MINFINYEISIGSRNNVTVTVHVFEDGTEDDRLSFCANALAQNEPVKLNLVSHKDNNFLYDISCNWHCKFHFNEIQGMRSFTGVVDPVSIKFK